MFIVHVTCHVKPDAIDDFITASGANHRGSRQEPGNLRWDLLRDTQDSCIFYLHEVYDDEAAFKAHQQTEHYFTWRDTVVDLLTGPRSSHKSHSVLPDPWM